MKCPKCGKELRQSKKDPNYMLCDSCRKKYNLANNHSNENRKDYNNQQPAKPHNKKSNIQKNTRFTGKKMILFGFIILFLIIIIAITLNNITSTTEDSNSAEKNTDDIVLIEPEYENGSIQKEIQDYATNIITENYTKTDIREIAINENAGTEEDGDYIILVRLTWNVKNSGSMSKEMLEMYSSDFAARIGSDQSAVNEVAIFWTVPYLDNASAKWAYERSGEGMYLSDNMIDSVFNQ